MIKYQVNVRVKNKLGFALKRDWIRKAIIAVLRAEDVKHYIEVGVVLTDDATVRRLNKKYRSVDRTTDILSFSLAGDDIQSSARSTPDQRIQLGEMIISYPLAVRQAKKHNCSIVQEIALLLVHGTLHLLGHDHYVVAEARRMEAKEKTILHNVLLPGEI